jgi:hypothetical protein
LDNKLCQCYKEKEDICHLQGQLKAIQSMNENLLCLIMNKEKDVEVYKNKCNCYCNEMIKLQCENVQISQRYKYLSDRVKNSKCCKCR